MTSNQSDLANFDFCLQVPEPSFPNSAGRMLALLQQQRTDMDYYSYAASMFEGGLESPGENRPRLYLRFMTMLVSLHDQLLCDIRDSSQFTQEARALFLGRLNSLQSIVFPASPRENCRGLSEMEYSFLEMAANMLAKEEQVTQGNLDEIMGLVDALIQELDSAEIDDYVKECIMELVRHARHAAEYYRIRGARGFREAFKRMLGEIDFVVLSQKGNSAETREWAEKQGWWNQAMNLLGKVNELASHVEKLGPVLEGFSRLSRFLGGS